MREHRLPALSILLVSLLAGPACAPTDAVGDEARGGSGGADAAARVERAEASGGVTVRAEELAVTDGDTLRWQGERVRLVGFDAPEGPSRYFEGSQEPWASRAETRLGALIREAGELRLEARGRDRYERLLAQLYVDGRPVGAILVEEGLAYSVATCYLRDVGPDDARLIEAASARRGELPPFDHPSIWKFENRR